MAGIYKSKNNRIKTITLLLAAVLTIFIVYCVWYVTDALYATKDEHSMSAAERAIINTAVQVYAIEGRYPTGIKYMEENYGLTLNRNKYVYYYQSLGTNMVPIVKVYPLKR